MCLLTFVPISNTNFLITSNRDENIKRTRAIPPKKYKFGGSELICPLDPASNGTWIGTNTKQTLVILNGGNKKHTYAPPYRQSRGKVILDFLQSESLASFVENYDFQGIEPFTLIKFKHENTLEVSELRWDENGKSLKRIDPTLPAIWSSVTLYTPKAISEREKYFENFLEAHSHDLNSKALLDFHHLRNDEDPENGNFMERPNGIQTINITQIEVSNQSKTMYFEEPISDFAQTYRIF
jgi:hypothetical protein